jgi:ubiquitin carboxyl-terminal hydrolase 4/11/15
MAQNSSVIADLFDGQQRIDTTCGKCGYFSKKFEPFRYLMLPIPLLSDFRLVTVHFVPLDSGIVKLTVQVAKTALVQQVLAQIATSHKNITDQYRVSWSSHVLLAEVYLCQFHRFADSSTPISDFRSDDKLFAFQVADRDEEDQFFAQLVHRKKLLTRREKRTVSKSVLFGLPSVMSISSKWTCAELYSAVQSHLSRFFLSPEKTQPVVVRFSSPDGSCEGGLVSPSSQQSIAMKGNWLYLAVDWIDVSLYKAAFERPLSSVQSSQVPPNGEVSLSDCLEAFTAVEKLSGENAWFCDKCQSKVDEAHRKISWSLAPDVLVILLKRFQFTSAGLEKISVPIAFPLQNLLLRTTSEVSNYDLYGVVNHFGSLSSGHYTALCRQDEERWSLFNDHEVAPVQAEAVAESGRSCYVLFYKRGVSRSANVINYSAHS